MGKQHQLDNRCVPKEKEKKVRPGAISIGETSLEDLYRTAEAAYQQTQVATGSDKLVSYMISKGTLRDRLLALSNQIGSNPEVCLRHLQAMVNLCKNNENRKEAVAACQQLKDVFIQNFLNSQHKLRTFSEAVGDRLKAAKKDKQLLTGSAAELSQFYLEHKVKHLYAEYLKCLENLLNDNLFFIKKTCLLAMAQLAKFPDLQNTILSALVNKFGDSDMQVVNELTKVLRQEVGLDFEMLGPLLKNIEEVMFRKNISRHAQFYCVNLLTNLNLGLIHEKHLNTLMELYFKLFRKLVVSVEIKPEKTVKQEKPDKKSKKKKPQPKPQETDVEEELSSKLFLNVIKGLNKLFPLVKGDYKQFGEMFEEKVDSLYRIVHSSHNCKVKVQLLLFLFQSQSHLYKQLPDRYYRCLYDFLLEPELSATSLLELFFDLLLVSLRQDTSLPRVMAFAKRLFQICFEASPNFIITCLILFSKLTETHSGLRAMLTSSDHFLEGDSDEKYDMIKREPLHAKAENSCLWELSQLRNHYHPSVRKFTEQLLAGEAVQYSGNPLLDFGLTNFIEKLCLRSERKSEGWKLKNKRVLAHVRPSKYESILQKPLDELKEDEEFLSKYLQRKKTISQNRKKVTGEKDIEEYADEVIEKEMDRLNGKEDDDQEYYDDGEESEVSDADIDMEEGDFEEDDEADIEGSDFDEMEEEENADQPQENFDEEDFDEDDEDRDDVSEEKDFNEVFDNIGEQRRQERQAKRKNKKTMQQGKTKPIHKKDPSKHRNAAHRNRRN